MQCNCGGNMSDATSTDKKKNLRLEYQVCSSCGRVGNEYLFHIEPEKLCAVGSIAREIYNLELPKIDLR